MRNLLLGAAAAVLFAAASPASAQRPAETSTNADLNQDAWYYDSGQMKVDPKVVHMQKAAARGAQRQARIAWLNWYGISVARPATSSTPLTSSYSPQWRPWPRVGYVYQ